MIDLKNIPISVHQVGYLSNIQMVWDYLLIDCEKQIIIDRYALKITYNNFFNSYIWLLGFYNERYYFLFSNSIRFLSKEETLDFFKGKGFPYSERNLFGEINILNNNIAKPYFIIRKKLLIIIENGKTKIWDVNNSNIIFSFEFSYDKIYFSEDYKFVAFSIIYEWDDLIIFDLENLQIVKEFSFSNHTYGINCNHTSARDVLFYQNEIYLFPHFSYDGLNGEFRVFDLLKNHHVNIILNKKWIYDNNFSIEDFKICHKKDIIIFSVEGKIRVFSLGKLLNEKKLFEYKIISEINNYITLFEIDEYGNNIYFIDERGCFCHNELIIDFIYINQLKSSLNYQQLNVQNDYFGIALDFHTIKSTLNDDGSFDTERTEIGELLYQLKYCFDKSKIESITKFAVNAINSLFENIDVIIPIPPSNINRPFQPIFELGKKISEVSGIPVDLNYLKKRVTPVLKSIDNNEARKQILKNAFWVSNKKFKNKNIILFDDIIRSGETLNAATKVLKEQGEVDNIYVLTITKTRTKR